MLSGILPVLIWLVVSILLVKFVIRPTGSVGRRMFIKWMVFAALMILPFADEIAGRMYLNYLCKTQAGTKVYKTVELPDEYWDEETGLNIFNEQGYLKRDFWLKFLDESGGSVERYSSIYNIDKSISTVVYKAGGELLGEVTTFRFWGGWVRQNFGTNNISNSCQFINDQNFSRAFYGNLFEQNSIEKRR